MKVRVERVLGSKMAHMTGTPVDVMLPDEDTAHGHLNAGSGPKV